MASAAVRIAFVLKRTVPVSARRRVSSSSAVRNPARTAAGFFALAGAFVASFAFAGAFTFTFSGAASIACNPKRDASQRS